MPAFDADHDTWEKAPGSWGLLAGSGYTGPRRRRARPVPPTISCLPKAARHATNCSFGDVSKCLKVGTWVVGPLGNTTCDPNVCSASSLASKCNDGLPRTIVRTRLYRVRTGGHDPQEPASAMHVDGSLLRSPSGAAKQI